MITQGYKVRGITPNDGNCFFWALADQLDYRDISQSTHSGLRAQLVDFMENLSQEDIQKNWQGFFDGVPLHAYITYLKADGTYADQLTIAMICEYLHVRIKIVQGGGRPDLDHGNPNDQHQLLLGYLENVLHYVSLQHADGGTTTPETTNNSAPSKTLPKSATRESSFVDINEGSYVAVRVPKGRKGHELYPALVLEVRGDEVILKYMRRSGNFHIFPEEDEIYLEDRKSILQLIDEPHMINNTRQQYKFQYNF
jgi:hypothetical protein